MSSRGNSGPSVFRVFLFVLYTQTVSNSGGCLCCCWLFLPSTAAHPLYLQEGWAWLWLMPCHGEWYNHSSSRQNWNQLLYLYSHNWSWGGKKHFSAAIQNNVFAFLFFPSDTFCTSVVNDDLRFPSKELPAAGGQSTRWLYPLCREGTGASFGMRWVVPALTVVYLCTESLSQVQQTWGPPAIFTFQHKVW